MKNSVLKVPFVFSEERLLQDLQVCGTHSYIPHFNDRDYLGTWTSVSLRSISGKSSDIGAHATGEQVFKDTDLIKLCPYFSEIIDSFLCKKESVRLLRLAPKSEIKEHTDHELSYADGLFRIHIPITTNSKVNFKVNGTTVEMEVGSCWYADFNLPHSVKNFGDTDRIHLVMDCVRNEWSDRLFQEMGYNFEEEKIPFQPDIQTKMQMIESLEYIDTAASRAIIEKLKKELASEIEPT